MDRKSTMSFLVTRERWQKCKHYAKKACIGIKIKFSFQKITDDSGVMFQQCCRCHNSSFIKFRDDEIFIRSPAEKKIAHATFHSKSSNIRDYSSSYRERDSNPNISNCGKITDLMTLFTTNIKLEIA